MAFTTTIHPLDDATAQMRWQALWEVSPQRSSFSSLPYARAAAEAFGLRCEMHLVTEADQDAAGALVYWRQRGPYRQVVIPPFTQYSPLVLRTPPTAAAVHARQSAFETLLAALEAHFAHLGFFIAITDVRSAQWRGWRVTPFFTYRRALQTEDPHQGWSTAKKRAFRKHHSAYRLDEGPGAAATIIQHCAKSYARHQRPFPTNPGSLQAFVETLHAAGHVRLFTLTPTDGTASEAGLAVLHDGRTAHYWIAGSTPGPAMTVLLGQVLPRLREAGLQVFDFVGANTPSIAEFKRHFGPELTPYYHLEKITRPELRLLYRLKGR